jgi:hypothetical protein
LGGLKKGGFLAHRSLSRSEDEIEIRAGEGTGGTGRERHPAGDTPTILGRREDTQYYAIGADFKPVGSSLLSRFGWTVAAAAIDGVFGEANDAVVPTCGSYELQSTGTGFPISSRKPEILPSSTRRI